MTWTISEPNSPERINRLCTQLFGSWRERGSAIPLAWRMHAWPIRKTAPCAMTRLLNTPLDLRLFLPCASPVATRYRGT